MIPKKSLGQHWLEDKTSLETICDIAKVHSGDTIFEIGPGTGELTAQLLERGAHVVAVEIDEHLVETLKKRFSALPFTLNVLSILDFDFSQLPATYKIVANIPYYLTNHLLRLLSETLHKPTIAVLLLQKEVAQRVAAAQGNMSLLSVVAQYYWEVQLGPEMPAKLFTPSPKVDSQVLVLTPRAQPLFPDTDTRQFFGVVKAGFSQRRKTILNSLSGGLKLSKTETNVLLRTAAIKPKVRPQELSLGQWHTIYRTHIS